MVICRCGFLMVRRCRYTKLMDSRYRYNRYRYHKNTIINKDISPLVGIVFLSLFELLFFIARIIWSLYSPLAYSNWDYDLIPQMIATYLSILRPDARALTSDGHVSLWLSCSCMISYRLINQIITSTLTSSKHRRSVVGTPALPRHICVN